MIDCLNNKNIEWLARVGEVDNKFNKFFIKQLRRFGLDASSPNTITFMIIRNADYISDEEYKRVAELVGDPDWIHHSAAVSTSRCLIDYHDSPSNSNTIIRGVSSTIYVPYKTIQSIAYKSKNIWERNFCIRLILRHELGHIMYFRQSIGKSLVVEKVKIDHMISEYTQWVLAHKSCSDTLDKYMEKCQLRVEHIADNLGGIKEKDNRRFYKIMTR